MARKNTLFSPAKDKRLAAIIDITSPTAFRRSIRIIKIGGVSLKENRALVLAQKRSKAQLKRKNLSPKERKQFSQIIKIRIPPITKRK